MKITFPVPKSKLISFFLMGLSGSTSNNFSYLTGFRGQCALTYEYYEQQWDGFYVINFGSANSNNSRGRIALFTINDDYSILTPITPTDWQQHFAYDKEMQYTYMT